MLLRFRLPLFLLLALALPTPALLDSTPSVPDTTFTNVSASAGIKIFKPSYGTVSWGDFNNDGSLDVFVINHGKVPSLYRNNADGTFTNRRNTSGISGLADRHGAAWGDYDNDGDLDLFITIGAERGGAVGEKQDQLYSNDGNGQFTDVTSSAGVANSYGRGRSVNWIDFNLDGHLDLFVANHADNSNALNHNNGDGTFTDFAQSSALGAAPGILSSWADFDNDGYPDLLIGGDKQKIKLWRNNGNGTFTDVTALSGIPSIKYSKGMTWGDYDNDGNIDLYIARGFSDKVDSLVWDSSLVSFFDKQAALEDGLDFTTAGTQVTFNLYQFRHTKPDSVFFGPQNESPLTLPFTLSYADAFGQPVYTAGQDLGFFIWTDQDGWHIRWSVEGKAQTFVGRMKSNGPFLTMDPYNFTKRAPSVSSILCRNNGDGTFTDVSQQSGTKSRTNNRGAAWGDYDNDGDLDLYVVNSGSIKGNGPNALFRNNGDGTFDNVAKTAKVKANFNGRGDGAAWGDFNNDGFLDLYLTNGWYFALGKSFDSDTLGFGPHALYLNDGNDNNWLKVRLRGTASNRDGIGAKVVVNDGASTQFREVHGGADLFSQSRTPIHFGLGSADSIQSLTVIWPSGVIQEMTDVGTNQTIELIE